MSTPNSPHIDRELLTKIIGPDLTPLRILVPAYVSGVTQELQELSLAVRSNDLPKAASHAHSLRGMAMALAGVSTAARWKELEICAKNASEVTAAWGVATQQESAFRTALEELLKEAHTHS